MICLGLTTYTRSTMAVDLTRLPKSFRRLANTSRLQTTNLQAHRTFSISIVFQVKGRPTNHIAYDSEKLLGMSGNYTFELQPTTVRLIFSAATQMTGIIKKNGRTIDANALENYLGAKAQFVVVGLAEKEYVHIHPQIVDGTFQLHTTFSKLGIHRGWHSLLRMVSCIQ
jgi:hypothetical protein